MYVCMYNLKSSKHPSEVKSRSHIAIIAKYEKKTFLSVTSQELLSSVLAKIPRVNKNYHEKFHNNLSLGKL